MTTRRDLLKYFGIGTAIVPVLGGVPRMETPAKLIATPEVEPIQVATSLADVHQFEWGLLGRGRAVIEVHVHLPAAGQVYHYKADTFIAKSEISIIDVTSEQDRPSGWRRKMAVPSGRIMWKMEGVCTGHTEMTSQEMKA